MAIRFLLEMNDPRLPSIPRAAAFALEAVDPLNTVAIEIEAAPDARIFPLTSGIPGSGAAKGLM